MSAIASLPVAVKPDVFLGNISLRGVLPEDLHLLWIWLNEFPRSNFDDYGPQDFGRFRAEIICRIERGEYLVCALHDGKPVGAMGYSPITERLGSLHGICFSREVHGKGVAPFAVKNFLEMIMASGKVQKIAASYFKDNVRIKKFLRNLGFVHEGTLSDHTIRGGKPVDMSLVALYRKNWSTSEGIQKGLV